MSFLRNLRKLKPGEYYQTYGLMMYYLARPIAYTPVTHTRRTAHALEGKNQCIHVRCEEASELRTNFQHIIDLHKLNAYINEYTPRC